MPRIMRRFTCSNLIKVIIWPVLVLYIILYAVKDNQAGDFEYHSEYCNCSKKIQRQVAANSVHFCSEISSGRGSHQDVVSYSLYGVAFSNKNKLTRYFSLLDVLPQQIRSFYPGWTMRIYHGISESQTREHHMLCRMYCQNDNVDLCNVRRLAKEWKQSNASAFDLVKLNPRKWRYLALMDPQVDRFMARDIDSEINLREQAAVNEWLHSNHTFHVMRDHQFHSYAIMAGMFAVKVNQRRDLVQGLTRALITLGTGRQQFLDQILLSKVFWPTVKDDAVIHDSYFCQEKWGGQRSRPFPTQRINRSFVSDRTGSDWDRPKPCPPACRPADHADWKFC